MCLILAHIAQNLDGTGPVAANFLVDVKALLDLTGSCTNESDSQDNAIFKALCPTLRLI